MEDRFYDILQRDVERAVSGLRQDLHEGFKGIHDRLDALNGRVRTQGESIAVLTQRVDSIEHDITDYVNTDIGQLSKDLMQIRQFCAVQHAVRRDDASYDGNASSIAVFAGKNAPRLLIGIGIGSGLTVAIIWQLVHWIKTYVQ